MADAEREEEPLHWNLFPALHSQKNVLCFLLLKEGETQEVFVGEEENIRRIIHDPACKEFFYGLLSQPLYVERVAGDEVLQFLLADGIALLVGATMHRFAFRADKCSAAAGAVFGEVERLGVLRPQVPHHLHHFRNDVTCFLHDHRITYAHIEPPDLIFIVQCCARHRGPGKLGGGEECHGGDGTGAAYLEPDVLYLGCFLLRRELVRTRPPRGFCSGTEIVLHTAVVHFDHDPIDIVRQGVPFLPEAAEELLHFLQVPAEHEFAVCREAHRVQSFHEFLLCLYVQCISSLSLERVAEHPQVPCSCHLRVQLAHGTRCGIARIREFLPLGEPFVHLGKCRFRHVDLSSDLNVLRQ